jgi:hypothetical protein
MVTFPTSLVSTDLLLLLLLLLSIHAFLASPLFCFVLVHRVIVLYLYLCIHVFVRWFNNWPSAAKPEFQ